MARQIPRQEPTDAAREKMMRNAKKQGDVQLSEEVVDSARGDNSSASEMASGGAESTEKGVPAPSVWQRLLH